jgi:hypothetical protein
MRFKRSLLDEMAFNPVVRRRSAKMARAILYKIEIKINTVNALITPTAIIRVLLVAFFCSSDKSCKTLSIRTVSQQVNSLKVGRIYGHIVEANLANDMELLRV